MRMRFRPDRGCRIGPWKAPWAGRGPTAIMLSKLAMLACVAGASAALELTPENYDKEVTASGKAAFIKFLAPW